MDVNNINGDKTLLGKTSLLKFEAGTLNLKIATKVPKLYNLLARISKNTFINRTRVYYFEDGSL